MNRAQRRRGEREERREYKTTKLQEGESNNYAVSTGAGYAHYTTMGIGILKEKDAAISTTAPGKGV